MFDWVLNTCLVFEKLLSFYEISFYNHTPLYQTSAEIWQLNRNQIVENKKQIYKLLSTPENKKRGKKGAVDRDILGE